MESDVNNRARSTEKPRPSKSLQTKYATESERITYGIVFAHHERAKNAVFEPGVDNRKGLVSLLADRTKFKTDEQAFNAFIQASKDSKHYQSALDRYQKLQMEK